MVATRKATTRIGRNDFMHPPWNDAPILRRKTE
jgi:hypothetical protein